MIPIKQTRFTSPLGTVKGNCFSACIASLLHINIELVPDFVNMDDRWINELEAFLEGRGYEFTDMLYFKNSVGDTLFTWEGMVAEYDGIDDYYLCGGSSHREHVKAGHAVIYHKMGHMAWDPHPNRDGLKELQYVYIIRKTECQSPSRTYQIQTTIQTPNATMMTPGSSQVDSHATKNAS